VNPNNLQNSDDVLKSLISESFKSSPFEFSISLGALTGVD
jgi:hypothetical protein